jgi:hypothetical protein
MLGRFFGGGRDASSSATRATKRRSTGVARNSLPQTAPPSSWTETPAEIFDENEDVSAYSREDSPFAASESTCLSLTDETQSESDVLLAQDFLENFISADEFIGSWMVA